MKIRIQNNSIRVRVNQEELLKLSGGEPISMTTNLPNGYLRFDIYPGDGFKVDSDQEKTRITLPELKLKQLFVSDDEGFQKKIEIDKHDELAILFQKDYVCIGRDEDVNAGLFPNPKVKDETC